MNKKKKLVSGFILTLALTATPSVAKPFVASNLKTVAKKDNTMFVTKRPAEADRLFVSVVIEKKIKEVKKLLKDNAYLAWMFENCFPNTLDTTVHFDGQDDTFVYTGDITAMWLRDSSAQVWPY